MKLRFPQRILVGGISAQLPAQRGIRVVCHCENSVIHHIEVIA